MINMLRFCIFFVLLGNYQFVNADSVVESEFAKFFNESLTSYKEDKVYITLHNSTKQDDQIVVDGTSDEIQTTIKFTVKAIKQILVLKLPESGYSDDGTFDEACKNDDVFVAGYNVKPAINISELTFRLRSRCIDERKRLLVWAKTSNGQYYMGRIKFFNYAAHQSNNW